MDKASSIQDRLETLKELHENGIRTVYANLLTSEFVVEGEKVKQGQTIGTVK